MNTSTVGGIIRAVLAALAGYLTGRGIDITGLLTPEITGAMATVIVAVWSIWAKRSTPPTTP